MTKQKVEKVSLRRNNFVDFVLQIIENRERRDIVLAIQVLIVPVRGSSQYTAVARDVVGHR